MKNKYLAVVAAIIFDQQGRILLSSRPHGKAYQGYWEFAGGKIEQGEDEFSALQRELDEELGLTIHHAHKWLVKHHYYPHAHVYLSFYRIYAGDYTGEIIAKEGQQYSWQDINHLTVSPLLPANNSIFQALSIPVLMQGNLARIISDNNGYTVKPYHLANQQDQSVLIPFDQLTSLKKASTKQLIWIIVENRQQFLQALDANVIVWHISNTTSYNELIALLQEGVSLPIMVASADKVILQNLNLLAHGCIFLESTVEEA